MEENNSGNSLFERACVFIPKNGFEEVINGNYSATTAYVFCFNSTFHGEISIKAFFGCHSRSITVTYFDENKLKCEETFGHSWWADYDFKEIDNSISEKCKNILNEIIK